MQSYRFTCLRRVVGLQRRLIIPRSANAFRLYSSEPATDSANLGPEKKETISASESSLVEKIKKLESEVGTKDKRIAELQDAYLRSVAECENVRQRSQQDVKKAAQFGIQKFAKDLLETADVLQMALKAVPEAHLKEDAPEYKILMNLYQGVDMTRKELLKTFTKHGIEEFEHVGEQFDPNMHQALFQAHHEDKPPGIVVNCVKTGYKLNGRILRPAHVGVTKSAE